MRLTFISTFSNKVRQMYFMVEVAHLYYIWKFKIAIAEPQSSILDKWYVYTQPAADNDVKYASSTKSFGLNKAVQKDLSNINFPLSKLYN